MPSLDSDELARLSPEERLALIGQLWDSLRDTEVPLPEDVRRARLRKFPYALFFRVENRHPCRDRVFPRKPRSTAVGAESVNSEPWF